MTMRMAFTTMSMEFMTTNMALIVRVPQTVVMTMSIWRS